MRGGGSDGPREDDWLAEEDWVDAPTEETRRSPSRRRLPQRPPGAPSRRLIILAAAVSIVLLAVLVAVLQGDDDAAGDPAPTVTPTETMAAPGSEAEPSLRLQESGTLSEGDSGPRARPYAWFETYPDFVRYEWSERSALTTSVCFSPSQASRTTTRGSVSPLARSTRCTPVTWMRALPSTAATAASGLGTPGTRPRRRLGRSRRARGHRERTSQRGLEAKTARL